MGESISSRIRRSNWILLAGLALSVLAVGWLIQSRAEAIPAGKPAKVSWVPSEIDETVIAGTHSTVEARFVVDQSVVGVGIEVVPELTLVVSVQPSVMSDLIPGVENEVFLSFQPNPRMDPTRLDGTVLVRVDANELLARPLPVKVDVVWPTFESLDASLIVSYPAYLDVVESGVGDPAGSVGFLDPQTKVGFSIDTDVLPPGIGTVEAWADSQRWPFPDDWRNHYEVVSLGDRDALHATESDVMIFLGCDRVHYVTNGVGREDRPMLDNTTFGLVLESVDTPCD